MTQDRSQTNDRLAHEAAADSSPSPRAASPPGAPSTPGTDLLGRYRIVEEIGAGGMASVHLARMDGPGGFQKWVAIKRIHPHLIADRSFVHMFLDEARIAARISHPNVATVFELGRQGSTYWIAMEYLHGEPLREVMRRAGEVGGPMRSEIASRVIADAAEGLHSAHELVGKNGEKLHLIHRDVTPHNLFVTYDGATKVVDFGIAKCSSRMSSTCAGTLKGKLAYMAPEQVHGEAIDRRTDIFALGVVLWELTTGRRLFRVDSDLGTLEKVRECDIPRPSTIVHGYPVDLEKIVMKALSKNRQERFATAREFSRALQSLLMHRGLFVGSDEVARYMQFFFRERIRRREAHLRWAANLTQTVHAERLLGHPRDLASSTTPSLHTYVSDTQAAAVRGHTALRPAVVLRPTTDPSSVPTLARRAFTRPRATTTHAVTTHAEGSGPSENSGDEAETIVTECAVETHSPASPLAQSFARASASPARMDPPCHVSRGRQTVAMHLPLHPGATSRPREVSSYSPALPSMRRRKSPNPPPRAATSSRLPLWAAATLSGALALLPAAGIFLTVSRALRAKTVASRHVSSSAQPSSTPLRPMPAPSGGVPAHSPLTAEPPATSAIDRSSRQTSPGAEERVHVGAAPATAGREEGTGDCMASRCTP